MYKKLTAPAIGLQKLSLSDSVPCLVRPCDKEIAEA